MIKKPIKNDSETGVVTNKLTDLALQKMQKIKMDILNAKQSIKNIHCSSVQQPFTTYQMTQW
jgi:hypothetical protein